MMWTSVGKQLVKTPQKEMVVLMSWKDKNAVQPLTISIIQFSVSETDRQTEQKQVENKLILLFCLYMYVCMYCGV